MFDIVLRPATLADVDYFFALHAESMGPYVDRVWGWDDVEQREYLTRTLDLDRACVVMVDGAEAGRLDVEDREDEIFLVLLELGSKYRGRGMGSWLIRDLVERSHARGKRVTLSVLQVNDRAYQLYLRLGFVETSRDGVAPEVRIRMVDGP